MSKGWIKIERSIKDHWLFQNDKFFKWWILMLIEVNHKDNECLIGYSLHKVKRGQSLKSLRTWATIFNCGTKQVINFFQLLETDKMITKKTVGKGKHSTTLINIDNYGQYQGGEETQGTTKETTQGTTQGKQKGNTTGIQLKNVNNEENDKNEKNDKELIVYSNEVNECFDNCLNHFPIHLHPTNNKQWIETIDKLNRIDNIPFSVIEDVVRKTRSNDFWSAQFLSLTKLRKTNKEGIKYIIVFNEKFKNNKDEKRNSLTEFNKQSRLENPDI